MRIQWDGPVGLQKVDGRFERGIDDLFISLRSPAVQINAHYIGMAPVGREFVGPNAGSMSDVEYLQAVFSRTQINLMEFAGQAGIVDEDVEIV